MGAEDTDPIVLRAFAEAPRPAADPAFVAAVVARMAAARKDAMLGRAGLVLAVVMVAALVAPAIGHGTADAVDVLVESPQFLLSLLLTPLGLLTGTLVLGWWTLSARPLAD